MSPISSRKIVPPSATSNKPRFFATAPVNAPRSWPNSSLSINSGGIAAQLTLTNGPFETALLRWIARAISSLPVPLSPVISTRLRVGATFAICRLRSSITGVPPSSSQRASAALRNSSSSRAIRRRSSALRTVTMTRARSSGFSMKSNAPRRVADTASSIVA
jgi:hypothetical protein